jgi:hypothetical protein
MIKIIKSPSGNILCVKLPNFTKSFKNILKKFVLAGWQVMVVIIHSLNLLTNNHTLLTLVMALGLGIGFGWSVFQTPDETLAINLPELRQVNYAPSSSNITKFRFNTFTISVTSKENNLWNHFSLVPIAYSDHSSTRYFKGKSNLYSYFNKLNVGDHAQITHTNNTIQTLTLIETKIIDQDKIRQFESNDRQQIVIFCLDKVINGKYWVGVFVD